MDDMGERCLKDGQVTLKLLLTYELLCKTGRHLPVSIYCAHSPRYVTVGASIARPVAVLLFIHPFALPRREGAAMVPDDCCRQTTTPCLRIATE